MIYKKCLSVVWIQTQNLIEMNVLKESEYIEQLNAYTFLDWQPLLDFIPIFESSRQLVINANDDEEFLGEYGTFYYPVPSDFIYKFQEVATLIPIIIDFDWEVWTAGWDIILEEHHKIGFDFDSIDIPTKCKIITAIVENEKTNKFGIIQELFKNGFIFLLLISLKRQLVELKIIDK